MTARPLLEAERLSKRFCRNTARSQRYGLADLAAEFQSARAGPPRLRMDEFWALDQASFSVARGEAVAIGGRNGAGKTTLLRLLAGLLKPDAGSITLSGTVNPVIELGQGLSPMLTGRENAQIGLAWRGIAAARVDTLVDEVAAFAELGAMFDAPVHSYSAGMRVRLAYAIAVAVPCDLLLLDEVLAVGDLAFQRKCIERMQLHLQEGGALILVSHNPVQMQALCRRGILLDQGKLEFDGGIEQCIDRMFEVQATEQGAAVPDQSTDAKVRIDSMKLITESGDGRVVSGGALLVEFVFTMSEAANAFATFSIWTRDQSVCVASFGDLQTCRYEAGSHVRRCRIPVLPLAQGTYTIKGSVSDPETYLPYATLGYVSAGLELRVAEDLSRGTLLARHMGRLVSINHDWLGDSGPASDALSGEQPGPRQTASSL